MPFLCFGKAVSLKGSCGSSSLASQGQWSPIGKETQRKINRLPGSARNLAAGSRLLQLSPVSHVI
jgi:hypothetical protein